MPPVSAAPTPPGVRLPFKPNRPILRVVVSTSPSATVSEAIANAPEMEPNPSIIRVPSLIVSSRTSDELSKATAMSIPSTAIVSSIASCNVFTRIAATAERLSPVRPDKLADAEPTSAYPSAPAEFCPI